MANIDGIVSITDIKVVLTENLVLNRDLNRMIDTNIGQLIKILSLQNL